MKEREVEREKETTRHRKNKQASYSRVCSAVIYLLPT